MANVRPIAPQRTRNAAATRQAMLDAARSRFASESYENVGLREIAADVGVDPALICRYFGNKEELFREVLSDGSPGPLFDVVGAEAIPAHLVSLIMEGDDTEDAGVKLDRLLIIMHSFSSPKASAIVSDAIDGAILEPISARLGGPDAGLRASLALIVLMGSGIVRNVMKSGSILDSNEAELRQRLLDLFETALRPAGTPSRETRGHG